MDRNYGANAGDQGRKAYGRGSGGRYGGYNDDYYGGGYDDDYFTDRGYSATPGEYVDTPLGQIKGMHHTGGNSYGGTHHTVYGNGQRISWDTDANNKYVDGSAHQKAN